MSAPGGALGSSAAVAAASGAVASPAWVVGGAIRDAALRHEVIDADIVVERGAEAAAANAIARAAGGAAFPLSEQFGTWRAISAEREWHVDVSALRGGDLEADLAQRDFTINALAVPLDDLGAAPVDPTGGLADLERRLLRAVS